MISYLKGLILAKEDNHLIIDVHNIGYQVFMPKALLLNVKIHDEITLYIHTHVREDQLSLYGFNESHELKFFKLLMTVSGIGPKLALEILSHPLTLVQQAIYQEDSVRLSEIPGLGKKTAQRLIIELKNKIEPQLLNGQSISLTPRLSEEIISALTSLGYPKYQVLKTLNNMNPEITENEEIVRYFLKHI